ncbi:MAG: GNAT family N-acetyltransferase, partial [Candidatus Obscuribacterales bacterium]|nr:GNAT family N-acetyltransferase [Candidatus Obscuribacterales bacterium]
SPDETVAFLEGTLACQREKPRRIYEFAITLKDTSKLIGACGIRIQDLDHDQAEIGYCYNKNYWGQGFASEAAKAVLNFGFRKLGLHRVIATCDTKNLASSALLRGCGMRQEGHFVQERKVRGQWRDTYLYAILREEFI